MTPVTTVPVTADTFIRAESDTYFRTLGGIPAALGKFTQVATL